jgi:hypothetical protein
MKRGSRHHTGKGTWKPSKSGGSNEKDASAPATTVSVDEGDDLDALLARYEAEAQAQAEAAHQASRKPVPGNKAQREVTAREQGLQQSLEPTNK